MKKHLLILTSLGAVICCILTVAVFFYGPAAKVNNMKYMNWKELQRRLPWIDRSNVKHLIINGVQLTKQDLKLLKTLQNLKRLNINGCGIDDDELQFIEGLTKLEFFSLNDDITGKGLVYLKSLKNIEYLNLSSRNLTDQGLIHLSKLYKLNNLRLSAENITGSGFHNLKDLKNLRHLTFFRSSLNDEGIKYIAKLKQLQSLEIGWKPPITDESLHYLAENYNLMYFGHPHTVSENALRKFRENLLKGRRVARKRGEDVPRDDKLTVSGSKSLKVWRARNKSGPSPIRRNINPRTQGVFWLN